MHHPHTRTVISRARVALITGLATAGLLAASGPAAAATVQKRSLARTHHATQKRAVTPMRITIRTYAKKV